MTQLAPSKKLGKQQATIAEMENRSGLMISTLRGYVEALGARLSLQGEFPDTALCICQASAISMSCPRGPRSGGQSMENGGCQP